MRRLLLKIVIALAVVWVGWWWIAATSLQSSVTAWREARQAEGWQADVANTARGGFPLRIATTLEDLALADAQTGVALRVPQITMSSAVYWPGYARVDVPESDIVLSTPDDALTLGTSGATAGMRLRPGTSLQLQAMTVSAQALTLDLPEGRLASLNALDADVQQSADPTEYTISLDATGLAPGALLRNALRLPQAWPEAFEVFSADMTVQFDRPWDRSALELRRPQPRAIVLHRAEAIWADLRIVLRAELTVDDQGVPSGTFYIAAENWGAMLDLTQSSGALPAGQRPQIENGLRILSGLSGNADTLDLEITIREGRMQMGFISLGTAPRIVLR